MFGLQEKIIIFDLECTTWEGAAARGWSGPNEHRELVQIGAALVETKEFNEISVLTFLVRPRINPILSDYFKNLTQIDQERVDSGVDFAAFQSMFLHWCEDYDLYCFDKIGPRIFDRDVLEENCRLYGIDFPFLRARFHNVNDIFHQHGCAVKQSGQAPVAFGIEPPARSHDALNDVRGLIVGLKALTLGELKKEANYLGRDSDPDHSQSMEKLAQTRERIRRLKESLPE